MIEKSRLPIVTLLLIVANLFAAFAVAYNPEIVMDFGFNPKSPSFPTIFTSLIHLVQNTVAKLLGSEIGGSKEGA